MKRSRKQADQGRYNVMKDRAVIALLASSTAEQAAKSIKVAPQTFRLWQKRPDFQAAYKEASREVFAAGLGKLRTSIPRAIEFLDKTIADEKAPLPLRIRAAASILEQARGGLMLADMQEDQIEIMKLLAQRDKEREKEEVVELPQFPEWTGQIWQDEQQGEPAPVPKIAFVSEIELPAERPQALPAPKPASAFARFISGDVMPVG